LRGGCENAREVSRNYLDLLLEVRWRLHIPSNLKSMEAT
jgi:hypothetical protein